jgi:serine/threonine-protein kinase
MDTHQVFSDDGLPLMPGIEVHTGLISPPGRGGVASGSERLASGVLPVALSRSGVVRHVPGAPAVRGEDVPATDLVGRAAHGLHIERLLAEGGMGAVYAARVAETGERVALKVLKREHIADAGIVSRFAREVRFARRIDHPNVCPVLDDGWLEDGRPFFVMPLYEGMTLGEEVRRCGPLPIGRALAIADQILDGLSAMHAVRVVHRDLQPDNVLLPSSSPGAEGAASVLLLDLGFAHEPGADTGDGVTPDSPGALVGTLRFMSPEQATRSRAITERSDLFAVGLLLYYALTGEIPFRGRTDLDVLVAIVRAAPIPLRRSRRDAPRALEDVLERALSKHPDARFGSAGEMRTALASVPAPGQRSGARGRASPRAPRAHRTRARSLR